MKPKRVGARHTLLIYRYTWDRLWRPAIILGVVCGALWWQAGSAATPLLATADTVWMLAAAIVSLGLGLFGLAARHMGYVRLYPTHFQIVTPFLRLKVSYRRVRSARPAAMTQLFPPQAQTWGRRRFLRPFYGMTAIAIELRGYPLSPGVLRLFLPRQLFLPQSTGFVLLVPDWMAFSTEIDTFLGRWRDRSSMRTREPGLLESLRKR